MNMGQWGEVTKLGFVQCAGSSGQSAAQRYSRYMPILANEDHNDKCKWQPSKTPSACSLGHQANPGWCKNQLGCLLSPRKVVKPWIDHEDIGQAGEQSASSPPCGSSLRGQKWRMLFKNVGVSKNGICTPKRLMQKMITNHWSRGEYPIFRQTNGLVSLQVSSTRYFLTCPCQPVSWNSSGSSQLRLVFRFSNCMLRHDSKIF